MRYIIKSLVIIVSLLFSLSCTNIEDDGSRGFYSKATVIGDSENGYYCFLNHGGYVFTRDSNLKGVERGYFSFSYSESDWAQTPQGVKYIDNAHVQPFNKYCIYRVTNPISVDNENSQLVINNNKNVIPELWGLSGYCGYVDLNMNIAAFNQISGEEVNADINLIYNPDKQNNDTLLFQLYCNPNVPSNWNKVSNTYGDISCDISSLSDLKQWKDSVVIVVETEDMKRHSTKISKQDFYKPSLK
ncbi:MAG: hypothetical protein Q4F97_04075 [Bacteroidales bacterium]|nr:hypothetical protein [Bacteroidales bacterium]